LTYDGGLTQESFDVPDDFEFSNNDNFEAFNDLDGNTADATAPILHVQASQLEKGVASSHKRLKPMMTELYGCLDTAGSEDCFAHVEKGLDRLIASVRK
jgi:hypothetical protein